MDRPRVVPPPRLAPWRQLRSETVASYRIIDIVKVTLEDGAGKPRGDGFTIRCADWCNVVAVTPDDCLVLVWQYRFGIEGFSLEIPGGVVDPGESPEQAARRELQEETGYVADSFEAPADDRAQSGRPEQPLLLLPRPRRAQDAGDRL